MISINAIVFSNYMICKVSDPIRDVTDIHWISVGNRHPDCGFRALKTAIAEEIAQRRRVPAPASCPGKKTKLISLF